jgi:hypothetical protein
MQLNAKNRKKILKNLLFACVLRSRAKGVWSISKNKLVECRLMPSIEGGL